MNKFRNDSAAHPTLTVCLPDPQKKWYRMEGGRLEKVGSRRAGVHGWGARFHPASSWTTRAPSWRLASFPSDATPPPPSVVDQHISTWNKCYFLVHPGFISLPVRENQRERGRDPGSQGLLAYSRQKRLMVPKEREGGRERVGKLTSSFNQIETRIIWGWKTVTLFSPQSLALSGAIKPFVILSFHKLLLNLMFKGPWRIIQLNYPPPLILLLNPSTKLMGD